MLERYVTETAIVDKKPLTSKLSIPYPVGLRMNTVDQDARAGREGIAVNKRKSGQIVRSEGDKGAADSSLGTGIEIRNARAGGE